MKMLLLTSLPYSTASSIPRPSQHAGNQQSSHSWNPQKIHPISLLSTLSKILEKILNKRLILFLESNKILNESQYGCQRERCAPIALTELDALINKSSLHSVFFNLENAFARVWRHHIWNPSTNTDSVATSRWCCKATLKIEFSKWELQITFLPSINKTTGSLKAPPWVVLCSWSP